MATTVVKTVKPSGGDYTSLAAAEAGEQRDLVTLDEICQIDCYAMNDGAAVTIDGWTTDATHYVHVNVPLTERHTGTWDTTKYYRSSGSFGSNGGLAAFQAHTIIEGVQGHYTNTSTDTFSDSSSSVSVLFLDCLAYNTGRSGFNSDSNSTMLVRCITDGASYAMNGGTANNCIAKGGGFAHSPGSGSAYLLNCVAVNNVGGAGFSGDTRFGSRFTYVRNCYAGGCAIGFDSTNGFSELTSCASDDGSAGTTIVPFSTATFVNVTPGSEDLHLVAGSALIDAGTDLSADPNWLDPDGFVDIEGNTRPQGAAWDIGVDEFISAVVAVAKSLTVTYAVATQVAEFLAVNYSILTTAQVAKIFLVSYNVYESVQAELSVDFAVRRSVPLTFQGVYSVEETVSKALVASYALTEVVSKALESAYSILSLGAVPKSLHAIYDVREQIAKFSTVEYNVRTSLSKSLEVSYSTRMSASTELTSTYVVRSSTETSLAASFDVHNTVGVALDVTYFIAITPVYLTGKELPTLMSAAYNAPRLVSAYPPPSKLTRG